VDRVGGAYLGGKKRRPRNEWQITRDTHPALIDDKQANYLLDCLETSTVGQAVAKAKAAGSPYLLTPLLETPEGTPWKGERHQYYRLKRSGGKRGAMVPVDHLQDAVFDLRICRFETCSRRFLDTINRPRYYCLTSRLTAERH
jgi:hypothetical protein